MSAVDADRGAIQAPEERPYAKVQTGFTAFAEDDVIMAKITPCMENGKAVVARGLKNGLGFGSTEFHVFRSIGVSIPEYIFHFIRQEQFRRDARLNMAGNVGQQRVPASHFDEAGIPVPPPSRTKAHRGEGGGAAGAGERGARTAGEGAAAPQTLPPSHSRRGLLRRPNF